MTYTLPCGHAVAHEDQIHYCSYMRLHDLLRLQPTGTTLRHPDEHLFVGIHQVFELLFGQILYEMTRIIDALDGDNLGLAILLVHRITRIAALFAPISHVLETMTFSDFFAFRADLAPASGSESEQFREIELIAGLRDKQWRRLLETPISESPDGNQTYMWTERLQHLWDSRTINDAFSDLLARRAVPVPTLYVVAPAVNAHPDLFLLAEALLDFDETFSEWRYTHARMAERTIGAGTQGTGNTSGVKYLDHVATRQIHLFPVLWQARSERGRTATDHFESP